MARRARAKSRHTKRSRKRQKRLLNKEPIPANKWGVTEEDLHLSRWFAHDMGSGKIVGTFEQVPTVLARAGERADEVWLWCLHCERFFQAKHLKLDFLGNWQRCPFDDCRAAGFDVEILVWDHGKHEDPNWPSSEKELYFGLQYPPRTVPRSLLN